MSPTPPRITPLTSEDCAQAATLHQAAFFKGWTENDFQDFLKAPLVFGLKIEGTSHFYGFILWRKVDTEAEILTLVIAGSFQRRGMGRHLLDAMFKNLKEKGVSKLFLEVAVDNKNAQSFYIMKGFTFLGTRPNYYERPENKVVDALIFCKEIKG